MSQPDPEELLSLDEIEAEFDIDRSTIYRRRKAGEIKQFKKVGDRRAYYLRSDLEELLKPRVVENEQ
jgi:predicted DNA-binding transcriptional regulator AlpA